MAATKRKTYRRCTNCQTPYDRPKSWQFCGRDCRRAWRHRDGDVPSAFELVRERLHIGELLELESRSWVREPLLRRAAQITELLK